MNLFDEMYIGFREGTFLDPRSCPLAFMVPDGTDSAARSRKETVARWCGRNMNVDIVPNDPQTGFSFDKAVSRYSTSNKWFRVQDPRGFTLEISAYNIMDIILNCTIIDGTIQDPLIWTREGSGNYLTRLDHEEYLKLKSPSFNRKPEPGDLLDLPFNKQVIYLGKFYRSTIKRVTHYNSGWNSYTSKSQTPTVSLVIKDRQTKDHFFISFNSYTGEWSYIVQASLNKYSNYGSAGPDLADWEDYIPNIGDKLKSDWNEISVIKNSKDEKINITMDEFNKWYSDDS